MVFVRAKSFVGFEIPSSYRRVYVWFPKNVKTIWGRLSSESVICTAICENNYLKPFWSRLISCCSTMVFWVLGHIHGMLLSNTES
jgi:hypothetical protein